VFNEAQPKFHRFSIMKPNLRSSLFLAAITLSALPLKGAILFATAQSGPNTPSTTTDEVAFQGDVSSSDLLHLNVGTGGSWNANGSNPNFLTDGLNGGDFDAVGLPAALVGAAWARDGDNVSFRTYDLGTGANGLGYDIERIQSIAGWQGAGFQNQRYNIFISTLTVPAYTLLTTVIYQPAAWVSTDAAAAKGGATKVNVTDSSGLLATGVVGIRFNILDTISNNGGGVVMREIDVFGTSTPIPEPTAALLFGLGGLALLRRRRA
jgi:hypothetical protein